MKYLVTFALMATMLASIGYVQPVASQMMCAGGDETFHFTINDVVFIGTVTSINPSDSHRLWNYISFDVQYSFKGLTNQSEIVVPTYQGSTYGFEPEVGSKYLIHASNAYGGDLFTSLCSDNKLLETQQDVEEMKNKLLEISIPPPLKQKQFQTGIIQWDSRCYSTHDVATVTVIDQDMNVDSNIPDQFQITIWSDWIEEETGESKVLPVNVIETGNSTGIFESLVFLGSAYDETSGHRIPVGIENTIFAKYVDYTVSDSHELEIIETTSAKILSFEGTWDRWAELSSLYDIPLVYDPCLKKQMNLVGTGEDFAQLDIFYPAPLKQIESGLHIDEVICKDNLVLIKKNNGYRYCVNPNTVPSLHERGWATDANMAGESSRMCYVEPDTGPCKAAIEKYYFDGETGTCKSFTWGGCNGKIPFDTLGLCHGLCGVENED